MDPKVALLRTLNNQREHALGILEGLDAGDLLRPVLPSGWSCVALMQHLALDVEQFWFSTVFAGEQLDDGPVASGASAWVIAEGTTPNDVFSLYRRQVAHSNLIIRAASLDQAALAWPGDLFGDWRLPDLLSMLLHVITETACHTGHLDAARELIDGRTWMVV